ncbi:lipopolysaccharide transport periplasmic protein LptA [Salinisphaera sp. SPP-AMP-43]|uniref:lipopolysaccharide transport periplasmic protein LptA n=1 Tax=Salinisphaera sp. SPP-AMP-43 TaxID=3121288 RepID=UPI003C6DE8D6
MIGLVAAGAMLLIAIAAQAAPSGSQKALPINIQANNANFTQKSGVSTYTGNVSMIRGGLTLTGDKLVVTRANKNSPVQAVLTGSPAHIDRKPDASDNQRVTGHAHRIEYTNGTSVITLRGNAVVNRGGDQIQGAVITHDVDTGQTHAERGSGQDDRVHITIQPGDGTP